MLGVSAYHQNGVPYGSGYDDTLCLDNLSSYHDLLADKALSDIQISSEETLNLFNTLTDPTNPDRNQELTMKSGQPEFHEPDTTIDITQIMTNHEEETKPNSPTNTKADDIDSSGSKKPKMSDKKKRVYKKISTKRAIFSQSQLSALEKRFRQQSFLSSEEREELAAGLKITKRQVMVWFQNRRGRLKKRGTADSAYNPIKLSELHIRRPYPFLYGMASSMHYQPNDTIQQPWSMYPQHVSNTAPSVLSNHIATHNGQNLNPSNGMACMNEDKSYLSRSPDQTWASASTGTPSPPSVSPCQYTQNRSSSGEELLPHTGHFPVSSMPHNMSSQTVAWACNNLAYEPTMQQPGLYNSYQYGQYVPPTNPIWSNPMYQGVSNTCYPSNHGYYAQNNCYTTQ